MLQFEIYGENIEITEAIDQYIKEKVGKVEKYFDEIDNIAHVRVKVYDNESKIEVTIPMKQVTLRAEEIQSDLYKAIDLIADKLERQVRKYKTRMNRKPIQNKREKQTPAELLLGKAGSGSTAIYESTQLDDENINISRHKTIDDLYDKPMSVEEAVLQMDMLDHDFFVFKNAENDQINIVYKRKKNSYGLIEI